MFTIVRVMDFSSTPQDGTAATRPARGRPPRLDQRRTVETALGLLDEAGLDALTMRRLAEAMGVQAGALYRYFATKQDLLTAMAEHMLAGCAEVAGDGAAWDEQVAGLARRMRAALLAHRDGARVYAGTHSTGTNTLGFADALIGLLRKAGFGAEDAPRAAFTLVNFTTGHTLEEQAALEGPGNAATGPDADRLREAVAATPGRFPHVEAALPTLTSSDVAAQFEFGLRLLLQGMSALRAPAHSPA